MIVISHCFETGTVIYGTARGDGTAPLIRGTGFRGSPNLPAHPEHGDPYWYLPSTRRNLAKQYEIEQCTKALRDAGYEVVVDIDHLTLPTTPYADLEADRYRRAEARTDRYTAWAQSARGQGNAMLEQIDQELEDIPLGQPHLIGHYSYNRTVRAAERRHAKEGRARGHLARGRRWAGRAESAAAYQGAREAIETTVNRIERLEAEVRSHRRWLTGEKQTWDLDQYPEVEIGTWLAAFPDGSRILHLDEGARYAKVHIARDEHASAVTSALIIMREEEIDYWKAHLQAAQEEAGIRGWSPDDFRKGDFVRCGGSRWYEIVRVNRKTLTLANGVNTPDLAVATRNNTRNAIGGPGWTTKIRYTHVSDQMALADAREAFPEAFDPDATRPGPTGETGQEP